MIPRAIRLAASFSLIVLEATPLRACPLCDSDTGRRVREGLFDADFGYHLGVTLLPFPVFLGVAALIYFGPPWPRGRDGQRRPTDAGDLPTRTREDQR